MEASGWPQDESTTATSPEPPGLADFKHAILQRVGLSPKQHHLHFCPVGQDPALSRTSLSQAIQLAEVQMVACPGVGEPLQSLPLFSPVFSPSPSKPVPFPWCRKISLRNPLPGGGLVSATAPVPLPFPQQFLDPGRSGPVCWRCGDPDHFVDCYPVMEVHRDVVNYLLLSMAIPFQRQKHSVEMAVNPHLRPPLILGTIWPDFRVLLEHL